MKNIREWEVFTENGWSDFYGIRQVEKNKCLHLKLINEIELICTFDHKLKTKYGWKKACILRSSDKLKTNKGYIKIKSVKKVYKNELFYDLLNVKYGKRYFTNNILSHNCIFLDEFAFVTPDTVAENFFTSVMPTISQGGQMIVVSTPNGASGKFHDIYTNSNKYGFNSLKFTWRNRPDRTEEWAKQTRKILGERKFLQEHECSFQGSSNTLLTGTTLSNFKSKVPLVIPEEGYQLWALPVAGRLYAAGVDVAKGSQTDYSVINIFDVTDWVTGGSYEQVALFTSNTISLFDFQAKILSIAKDWNNAFLIVETNQLGSVLTTNLYQEYEYEYMYYDFEKGTHGVNSNIKTKPLALSYFKTDLESNKMIIHSEHMIKELNYFEEVRPGVFSAKNGRDFHDDLVAGGYWVSFGLRSRSFEDYVYTSSKRVMDSESTTNNEDASNDEDILNTFNKMVRPPTDIDIMRNQLRHG